MVLCSSCYASLLYPVGLQGGALLHEPAPVGVNETCLQCHVSLITACLFAASMCLFLHSQRAAQSVPQQEPKQAVEAVQSLTPPFFLLLPHLSQYWCDVFAGGPHCWAAVSTPCSAAQASGSGQGPFECIITSNFLCVHATAHNRHVHVCHLVHVCACRRPLQRQCNWVATW
jgi:hypothetical protein